MGRSWQTAIVAICFVTSACGNQPDPADEPDCLAAAAKLDACWKTNVGKGGRAALLACVPYSKPQRITGTWARDFEFNAFFDGQEVTPERAWSSPVPSTRLEANLDLPKDSAGVDQAAVIHIVFDGRRPLCDLVPGEQWLIVDRIVQARTLQTRPSPWRQPTPR